MQRPADQNSEQTLRPRLRLARYPFETGINPYQSLLHRSVKRHGLELTAELTWEEAATRVAERLTEVGEPSRGGITLTRATADA